MVGGAGWRMEIEFVEGYGEGLGFGVKVFGLGGCEAVGWVCGTGV